MTVNFTEFRRKLGFALVYFFKVSHVVVKSEFRAEEEHRITGNSQISLCRLRERIAVLIDQLVN